MPYCNSAPAGSEISARPSRPAPTAPSETSTQLPLRTPEAMASMSSAIQMPAQGVGSLIAAV
jgi:hypothetical protein